MSSMDLCHVQSDNCQGWSPINPAHSHFSTLAVSQLVCKVSIDLLTLAGLSTNISTDRPANPGWCTVSLQTCRPWQVYGQFSDRVDLMSQTC